MIDGEIINLPPDPGIYAFEIPREAIPHLQEHAGVFVGYNCVSTDCFDAVEQLRSLVEDQLSLGARVVMAPDCDLDDDTIALAAWTRIDALPASDYDDDRARAFIEAHSCRFDPEGFCGRRRPEYVSSLESLALIDSSSRRVGDAAPIANPMLRWQCVGRSMAGRSQPHHRRSLLIAARLLAPRGVNVR